MSSTATPFTAPAINSSHPKKRRKATAASSPALEHRAILARRLDMLAGCELQHGHHLAAENLARRAQALREARL